MDMNTTNHLIGPISETFYHFWELISVFVGGLFGLYVIFIVLRVIQYKRESTRLKSIERKIDEINHKLNNRSKPKKRR